MSSNRDNWPEDVDHFFIGAARKIDDEFTRRMRECRCASLHVVEIISLSSKLRAISGGNVSPEVEASRWDLCLTDVIEFHGAVNIGKIPQFRRNA